MADQTPTPNDDLRHKAAGNLAFLLSVIRSGETLHSDEEAHVRDIIKQLEADQNFSVGLNLIAEERHRQVAEEGFDADHDDRHGFNDLSMAAACYAASELIFVRRGNSEDVRFVDPWPWKHTWDKRRSGGILRASTPFERSHDDWVRILSMAGALVAAEIDRLARRKAERDQQDATA